MQPIKLLHTADIHIGMENYGRIDPATGINARVMDFLRRLSDIGDYAIEQGMDVFVFAGDAYKTRDPNPTHQREFAAAHQEDRGRRHPGDHAGGQPRPARGRQARHQHRHLRHAGCAQRVRRQP